MKLSLQSVLAIGTLLAGIVLSYADLKYGIVRLIEVTVSLKEDVATLKKSRRSAANKLERLEVNLSHLQSRLAEARVKK